ncbi:hypothetical protein C6P45_000117 [Maudiozyma exigua]|uniref:Uncharacterized protein n=1 Tax=Maudiozyma exigua TaxID=34358 RepID=A0A9P6WFZ9_MAUEX|nr:hypothetical protein C6P45_000117 [Kazachstania exigua]
MIDPNSARFVSKVENLIDPVNKPDNRRSDSNNSTNVSETNVIPNTTSTPAQFQKTSILPGSRTQYPEITENNNISRPNSSQSVRSAPAVHSKKRRISDLLAPRPRSSSATSSALQPHVKSSTSCPPNCIQHSDCSSCSSCTSSVSNSSVSSSASSRVTSMSMQGTTIPNLPVRTKSLKRKKIPPPLNISPTTKYLNVTNNNPYGLRNNSKQQIPSSAVTSRFRSHSNTSANATRSEPKSAPADVTTFQNVRRDVKPRVVYLGKENTFTATKSQSSKHPQVENVQQSLPYMLQPNGIRVPTRFGFNNVNTPTSSMTPQLPLYPFYPITPWGTPTNMGINPNTQPPAPPSFGYAYTYPNYQHDTYKASNLGNRVTFDQRHTPALTSKRQVSKNNHNNIRTQTSNNTPRINVTNSSSNGNRPSLSRDSNNDQTNTRIMSGEVRLMDNVFSFEFPSNNIPTKDGKTVSETTAINKISKQLFMNICGKIWDESQLLH